MFLEGYSVQHVAAPSIRHRLRTSLCSLPNTAGSITLRVQQAGSTINHPQGIKCPENCSESEALGASKNWEVSDRRAMLPPGGQQSTQLPWCPSFPSTSRGASYKVDYAKYPLFFGHLTLFFLCPKMLGLPSSLFGCFWSKWGQLQWAKAGSPMAPCRPCFLHPYVHTPWTPIFVRTVSLVHPPSKPTLGISCAVLEREHCFHSQNAPTPGEEGEKRREGHGPVTWVFPLGEHQIWTVGARGGILKFVRGEGH